MLELQTAPPSPVIVVQALARLNRNQLAGIITVAIDLLDIADGDTDLEPNGDELDGDWRSEDSFEYHGGYGPGCPVADDDHEEDGCEPDDGT